MMYLVASWMCECKSKSLSFSWKWWLPYINQAYYSGFSCSCTNLLLNWQEERYQQILSLAHIYWHVHEGEQRLFFFLFPRVSSTGNCGDWSLEILDDIEGWHFPTRFSPYAKAKSVGGTTSFNMSLCAKHFR